MSRSSPFVISVPFVVHLSSPPLHLSARIDLMSPGKVGHEIPKDGNLTISATGRMHPVHLPSFASPGLYVRTASSPIQERRPEHSRVPLRKSLLFAFRARSCAREGVLQSDVPDGTHKRSATQRTLRLNRFFVCLAFFWFAELSLDHAGRVVREHSF